MPELHRCTKGWTCGLLTVCDVSPLRVHLYKWHCDYGVSQSSQSMAGPVEGRQNNDLAIGSVEPLDSLSHRHQSNAELYEQPLHLDSLVSFCPVPVLAECFVQQLWFLWSRIKPFKVGIHYREEESHHIEEFQRQGWRSSSVFESTCSSRKGPGFRAQHPYWAAYNHP